MFLPGASEIHRLRSKVEADRIAGLVIHTLFGEMRIEAQQQVLEPAPRGQRKLILATNIAETSLTIDGVRVVVDTGLARRSLFDPGTGMERLVTVRISQASATQRAGRAGRTAPGSAWRLWGEGAQATLAPQTSPEILNSDLAPLALELAQWGVRDAQSMPWMDAPPVATLEQARALLRRLEAIDERHAITATGRAMLETGLHPRLAPSPSISTHCSAGLRAGPLPVPSRTGAPMRTTAATCSRPTRAISARTWPTGGSSRTGMRSIARSTSSTGTRTSPAYASSSCRGARTAAAPTRRPSTRVAFTSARTRGCSSS
jgi:hypothetical protein